MKVLLTMIMLMFFSGCNRDDGKDFTTAEYVKKIFTQSALKKCKQIRRQFNYDIQKAVTSSNPKPYVLLRIPKSLRKEKCAKGIMKKIINSGYFVYPQYSGYSSDFIIKVQLYKS